MRAEGKQIRRLMLLLLLIVMLSPPLQAQTRVPLGETNPPQNIVLIIVDGMGSRYIDSFRTPAALDGSTFSTANVPLLEGIISKGVFIPNVKTPDPSTGPAHAVIVTGLSRADEEMAGFPDATIYDILHDEGYVSLAIMHKGDFAQMRSEQDIILFSKTNSIDEPDLAIEENSDLTPDDIIIELENWEHRLPEYLEGTKGIDSYLAYETWELDAASRIVAIMGQAYPDMKYILTINVGVADSAGHYRGFAGYKDALEGFDSAMNDLYLEALRGNAAVVITADHGMAFKSFDSARGGHASDDYSSVDETVMVPLLISAPNIVPGVQQEMFGQEDIAPTVLSILDIPVKPRYADGEAIPVKSYANLWVTSDTPSEVELIRGSDSISRVDGDSSYSFTGLEPEFDYIVRISDGREIHERTIHLEGDRLISFERSAGNENRSSAGAWRKSTASALILVVVTSALILINKIKD